MTPHQPPKYFGVRPDLLQHRDCSRSIRWLSYQFTDRLAIGGGPVITTGAANFAPRSSPEHRVRWACQRFPAATNSHPFWGAGFQLGLLYEVNDDWNVGFSYKSPVWQQRWEYNAATRGSVGASRSASGFAAGDLLVGRRVQGNAEKALIDVDLRYIDYANAQLFGQSPSSGGLGWRSVFAVATGMQYALTERLTLRGGYLFNTNPIPAPVTLFNVQAPAITQHTLSMGASFAVTENITASFAWVHAFDNSIQGPILQVPGSSVKLTAQIDSIVMGMNMTFGGPKKVATPEPVPYAVTRL